MSEDMLGRSPNGSGEVINSSPKALTEAYINVNGMLINSSSCD